AVCATETRRETGHSRNRFGAQHLSRAGGSSQRTTFSSKPAAGRQDWNHFLLHLSGRSTNRSGRLDASETVWLGSGERRFETWFLEALDITIQTLALGDFLT